MPTDGLREFLANAKVPCGHPPNPVAFVKPDGGAICHCGCMLDRSRALDRVPPDAPGPIVPCSRCGCYVAVPSRPSATPAPTDGLSPMLLMVCYSCRTGVGGDPYAVCNTLGCVFRESDCRPERTALRPARTREEMIAAGAPASLKVYRSGTSVDHHRNTAEAVLIAAGVIQPEDPAA